MHMRFPGRNQVQRPVLETLLQLLPRSWLHDHTVLWDTIQNTHRLEEELAAGARNNTHSLASNVCQLFNTLIFPSRQRRHHRRGRNGSEDSEIIPRQAFVDDGSDCSESDIKLSRAQIL